MKGMQKLKSGNYNLRNDVVQPDGSVIITLVKRGEGKVYKFRVKDLYGKHEEVLSEEVIEV